MIKIELSDVVAEVRRLAAESPEKIYRVEDRTVIDEVNKVYGATMCFNVQKNADGEWEGSCIIGKALFNLGVTGEMFESAGAIPLGIGGTVEALRNGEYVQFTSNGEPVEYVYEDQHINWMGNVQIAQDNASAWAVAVATAGRI